MPLEICNGCGRPAFVLHELVYYCGTEDCLKKLVHVIEPTKFVDLIETGKYRPLPLLNPTCRVKPIDSRVLGNEAETQALIDAYNRHSDEEEWENYIPSH